MPTFDDLLRSPCVPRPSGTPGLAGAALEELDRALGHDWRVEDGRLRRTFRFPDFRSALAYVDRVGAMSDEVDHHPEIRLAWGRVDVEIWTHTVGGLTETDFAWAARAQALADTGADHSSGGAR